MSSQPAILWLRRDLRRTDHPALAAAARAAGDAGVVVLFVLDPDLWKRAGAARRAWLAASVRATARSYDAMLCLRAGDPRTVVPEMARQTGAGSVHVSRETTPVGRRRDAAVQRALATQGVQWVATGSPYAVEPGTVTTATGGPYRVFTPFSRAWQQHGWGPPEPDPPDLRLARLPSDGEAERLLDAALGGPGIPALPEAGERAARVRWDRFRKGALPAYAHHRDRPDLDGVSRLSPYLKVGAIHPRTLLADLAGGRSDSVDRFVTELAWREFYADVLWRSPESAWHDLRPALKGMAYDVEDGLVQAWREGRTGYPVVDAAMRQLLAEGWIHNRMRMVAASFLTKDLHTWWPVGARHFLDHLIDGDVASNSHGWQWVAGTGTDAAPYLRVFNPVAQGLQHDPEGDYVRRYVAELAHLEGNAAHQPWMHPDGYRHGYPGRIVDHAEERREALRRYDAARG